VSALLRGERLVTLLGEASLQAADDSAIAQARERARKRALEPQAQLRSLGRQTSNALEDLQQLGLMASVLSNAALIEATAGNASERSELSIVAREFADRSEQVTTVIRGMLARHTKSAS
jgi:hypothetical protein